MRDNIDSIFTKLLVYDTLFIAVEWYESSFTTGNYPYERRLIMLDLTKEMLEKFDIKINSGLTEEEKEKIGKLTKKIQELQAALRLYKQFQTECYYFFLFFFYFQFFLFHFSSYSDYRNKKNVV